MNEQVLQPQNWLNNYGDYLYSVAFIKVNNKEVAEDLVQDTFLSAFKAREQFRSGSTENLAHRYS
jgi:DNA-directed RNA polymerase specialized sigma24 family protein